MVIVGVVIFATGQVGMDPFRSEPLVKLRGQAPLARFERFLLGFLAPGRARICASLRSNEVPGCRAHVIPAFADIRWRLAGSASSRPPICLPAI